MDIQKIRETSLKIAVIGNHPGIIQSMLDYDFLVGHTTPSTVAVVANGRNFNRYFFGKKEILLPVYPTLVRIPQSVKSQINTVLNVSSGRRVLTSMIEAIDSLPSLIFGTIFAEGVPEKHAIELFAYAKEKNISLVGPSSVGVVIPGSIKVGAIGGVSQKQIVSSGLLSPGGVCVLSASGGMVNEIINTVNRTHNKVSFSLSFGGDRFPLFEPVDALMSAQKDENTKAIVYYGELGGEDEYKLAKLLEIGHITKPVICYVAGTISDLFETPPQFGHAKAMAGTSAEGAKEKREALKKAGAQVPESFSEFVKMIQDLSDFPVRPASSELQRGEQAQGQGGSASGTIENMDDRKHALISSSISKDVDGEVQILGEELLSFASNNNFAKIIASMFLGKKIQSTDTEELVDFILKVSVDHGPYVSGALNTIVSARAGKDLVSSLSSGLLTIGPRFGGALNEAARNWFTGVVDGKNASVYVEEFAVKKLYIQGIGHKKYRTDMPDPRVSALKGFLDRLSSKRFTNFALEVEKVTTEKKGNLILNVDGTIAALLLDYLSEKEGYSDEQLWELIEQEFFNALFVLSRSVGFIAHYLDQKRLDEGLLRLEESDVADASSF